MELSIQRYWFFPGQGTGYTNPNGLAIFRPQTYCLLAAKYFDNNSC